jgi:hypothetical protein
MVTKAMVDGMMVKMSELKEVRPPVMRNSRRNRVHQRKIERLYNRNIVNTRKLGNRIPPLQGEWLFARHSARVKDFVRIVHLTRNRSPKMWWKI